MSLYPGYEPIEGYRLVEPLGGGGYGVVWKATAPGGLVKAVKFVHGGIGSVQGQQEMAALERMRTVRHPFLLSLERIEVVKGQLLIVTELADGSMMDRFKQARAAGLPGIPRKELLGWLADAADALDYMNETWGLQHLDIKPQNVLLVGGRGKMADFGLVHDLSATGQNRQAGFTPAYAPPEALEGNISSQSDQYSLAIVYQEMLTSTRPFPGQTALQLTVQHLMSPPMLEALPVPDRPIIARALAKAPGERYGCCRELIAELQAVKDATTLPVLPIPTEPSNDQLLDQVTQPRALDDSILTSNDDEGAHRRERAAESILEAVTLNKAAAAVYEGDFLDSAPTPWTPQPVLIVGVGGVAGHVLARVRQILDEQAQTHGKGVQIPWPLRLLVLDSDRNSLFQLGAEANEEAPLRSEELLLLPLRRPEDYRQQSRELGIWLDRRWLFGIPRSQQTEGIRPLGRLAAIDHEETIVERLRENLRALCALATRQAEGAGLGVRVIVVANLAGATGSGAVFDIARMVRAAHPPAVSLTLLGILLHGTPPKATERDLARVNTCSALLELDYYQRQLPPLFDDCYLYSLGEELDRSRLAGCVDTIAEYLILDNIKEASRYLHRMRQVSATRARPVALTPIHNVRDPQVRGFGTHRLSTPVHRLATLATTAFCRQLIQRWVYSAQLHSTPGVRQEAQKRLRDMQMDAEKLAHTAHHHQQEILGATPEAFGKSMVDNPQESIDIASTFSKVLEVFGYSPELLEGVWPTADATRLETLLHTEAVRYASEKTEELITWMTSLVEDPHHRLPLACLVAADLVRLLRESQQQAFAAFAQARNERAAVGRKLLQVAPPPRGLRRLFAKAARRESEDIQKNMLASWCGLRGWELAWLYALDVLRICGANLVKFTEELHFASIRIKSLAERAATRMEDHWHASQPTARHFRTELLPHGARELTHLVRELSEASFARVVEQFDQTIQRQVLDPVGGLWGLAHADDEHTRVVLGELQQRAMLVMLQAFAEIDVAQLFLQSHNLSALARNELENLLETARPSICPPEAPCHLLLALPATQPGGQLRDLIRERYPAISATVVKSDGDVTLHWEAGPLPLFAAARRLLGNLEPYVATARKVVTRIDLPFPDFL